ncbi:hypothetical protein BJY01DRAFT_224845 [Aspergillus pseudoustus]|uniref:Uncharacterized protein n=1 Tax=Aspergillus pseudoustus TaxID=1810923 RepID=A0ABR4J277_9EURO
MRTTNSVFALFLVASATATAQSCDYSRESNCINPQTNGTKTFEFKPLFPSGASLVYAVDSLSSDELQYSTIKDATTEAQRIAFWVEYPEVKVDNDDMVISQVGMLFSNASQSVEGDNGGCNGVVSSGCADNLKDVLKWGILRHVYEGQNASLYQALGDLYDRPLTNLSCPGDLFDDSPLYPTVAGNGSYGRALAIEATEANTKYFLFPELLPSGNSSYTYSAPIDRARSYSAQLAKTGVGILARVPVYLEAIYDMQSGEYEGEKNVTYDEIEVEFVCLSAGDDEGESQSQSGNQSADSGSGSGNGDGEDNDENSAARASGFALSIVVAGFAAVAGLV